VRLQVPCVVVLLVLAGAANCQQPFVMEPIRDNTLRFHLRVIGGTPAIRKDWPGTLRFQTLIANRLINCTSTVVGDHVLLTAAHCVEKDGARGSALFGDSAVNVTCSQHPKFKGANACLAATTPEEFSGCAPDVALCRSDNAVPAAMGPFESVNIADLAVAQKAKIILLGYGCTAANGPISTVLQVGQADIRYLGKIGAASPLAEYLIADGGSAICSGDSGGASFDSTDPKSRKIIAIISRGNLSTTSYLVNTSDPVIVDFLREWRLAAQLKICGLDPGVDNCRP